MEGFPIQFKKNFKSNSNVDSKYQKLDQSNKNSEKKMFFYYYNNFWYPFHLKKKDSIKLSKLPVNIDKFCMRLTHCLD